LPALRIAFHMSGGTMWEWVSMTGEAMGKGFQ
jgi:hypothetical protein